MDFPEVGPPDLVTGKSQEQRPCFALSQVAGNKGS